jgi:hypothetical protein
MIAKRQTTLNARGLLEMHILVVTDVAAVILGQGAISVIVVIGP